jgi:ribonuclease HI
MRRGVTAEWKDATAAETLRARTWPPAYRGSSELGQAYQNLLAEELAEGVIRPIAKQDVAWCNPTFMVPKKTDEWRKILDCSILNDYFVDRSFQMEDVRAVRLLAQLNDWATTLDISSAYLHVPVEAALQPFLSFEFKNHHYCYTGMPFGLKCAPRVFTLLMRKVVDHLRETLQARILVYMDDLLILGKTSEETMEITRKVMLVLIRLGWTLSWEKCHLSPSQTVEFLGWEFNLRTLTVRTTRSRRSALLGDLSLFLTTAKQRTYVQTKKLAALLGSLNFLRLQFVSASLYTTKLNTLKTHAVSRTGWDGQVRLTPAIAGELKWWMRTLTRNHPGQLRPDAPGATLVTDASPWGWGASLQLEQRETVRAWDEWTWEERQLTSNHKECLAVLRALETLRSHLRETRTIRVLSDNTSTVYNIQKWKGVRLRVPALRKLSILCQTMHWTLITQYLPGAQNSEADALSRMGSSGEYRLNSDTCRRIWEAAPTQPTLDVFAHRETHVLPRYMTQDRSDPEACAIDGLAADWRGERVHLHPPLNLIGLVLRKVEQTQASGTIVVPNWKGQPWTPLLNALSRGHLVLGPYRETMTRTKAMEEKGFLLPPGEAVVHFLDTRMTTANSSSIN